MSYNACVYAMSADLGGYGRVFGGAKHEPHTRCYMMYMFSLNPPKEDCSKNNSILFFYFGRRAEGLGVNARSPKHHCYLLCSKDSLIIRKDD